MENPNNNKSIFLSISILVGMMLLGFFIYKGMKTFSDKDRIVTVKGLAEIDMKATSAKIILNYNFSGDHLDEIMRKSEAKKQAIIAHLKSKGVDKDLKEFSLDINDRQTYYDDEWQGGQKVKVKVDRYMVTQRLSIASANVEESENLASTLKLELINKDLTSNIRTNYEFPELNSVKPQLIAESTVNARIAGEQFANDSKAKLGKIKTASQGPISIAGAYSYDDDASGNAPTAPYIQRARVVSTIVFFLE
jgi:hypothetical protein